MGQYPNFGTILSLNGGAILAGAAATPLIINGTPSQLIAAPFAKQATLSLRASISALSGLPMGGGVVGQLQACFDPTGVGDRARWAPLQVENQTTGNLEIQTQINPNGGTEQTIVLQTTSIFGCPFLQYVLVGSSVGGSGNDLVAVTLYLT